MLLNIFDFFVLVVNSGLNYDLGIKKSSSMKIINAHQVIFMSLIKSAVPRQEEFNSVGP